MLTTLPRLLLLLLSIIVLVNACMSGGFATFLFWSPSKPSPYLVFLRFTVSIYLRVTKHMSHARSFLFAMFIR